MLGWVVTRKDLKSIFSSSLPHTHTHKEAHTDMHTLSFLRDEVSQAVKVPFPSISGRPQRSAIGETNGAGPISCLVPFESAKLLRTSKKISQFIWDLLLYSSHTWEKVPYVQSWIINFMHTHLHLHIRGTIVFQIWPRFKGFPPSKEWSRQSRFAVLAQRSIRHEGETIKVTVI